MQNAFAPSYGQDEFEKTKKPPRSTLVSRNVTVAGHRTSVRLEPDMWSGLTEICRRERASLHEVCTMIANRKDDETSLTAAIRVYIMAYFRAAATEDGHSKASHGYGVAVTRNQQALATPTANTQNQSPYLMGMSRVGGTIR